MSFSGLSESKVQYWTFAAFSTASGYRPILTETISGLLSLLIFNEKTFKTFPKDFPQISFVLLFKLTLRKNAR